MEEQKIQLDSRQSAHATTARGGFYRRWKWVILAARLIGIGFFCYFSGLIPAVKLKSPLGIQHAVEQLLKDWTWTDIQPSRNLEWHKCYEDKFDCARLDVSTLFSPWLFTYKQRRSPSNRYCRIGSP